MNYQSARRDYLNNRAMYRHDRITRVFDKVLEGDDVSKIVRCSSLYSRWSETVIEMMERADSLEAA